jgi:hypothetical protein
VASNGHRGAGQETESQLADETDVIMNCSESIRCAEKRHWYSLATELNPAPEILIGSDAVASVFHMDADFQTSVQKKSQLFRAGKPHG